jgi:hypothetical protein
VNVRTVHVDPIDRHTPRRPMTMRELNRHELSPLGFLCCACAIVHMPPEVESVEAFRVYFHEHVNAHETRTIPIEPNLLQLVGACTRAARRSELRSRPFRGRCSESPRPDRAGPGHRVKVRAKLESERRKGSESLANPSANGGN